MKKLFILLFFVPFLFGMVLISGKPQTISLTTPTYDAGSYASDVSTDFGTTCTVTLNTTDDNDRAFILVGFWTNGSTASGATFDGNGATKIIEEYDTTIESAAYIYKDPGSADFTGNKNYVLTISGNESMACWAIQVNGIKTDGTDAEAIDVSNSDIDEGSNPQEISVSVTTTTNNSLIVAGVATNDAGGAVTHSQCGTPTGQTLFSDIREPGSIDANGGYYDKSLAGAQSICFKSDIIFRNQVEVVFALKPTGS